MQTSEKIKIRSWKMLKSFWICSLILNVLIVAMLVVLWQDNQNTVKYAGRIVRVHDKILSESGLTDRKEDLHLQQRNMASRYIRIYSTPYHIGILCFLFVLPFAYVAENMRCHFRDGVRINRLHISTLFLQSLLCSVFFVAYCTVYI